MRLIKRVRLKRVKYGDLDDGDRFKYVGWSSVYATRGGVFDSGAKPECEVISLETTKHPPESVTYDIVGIGEKDIPKRADGGRHFSIWVEDESEIETVYE